MTKESEQTVVHGLLLTGALLFASQAYCGSEGAERLVQAYPEHLCEAHWNSVVWCDGTEMVFDDGVEGKTQEEKLRHGDLQDQMEQSYPYGTAVLFQPARDFEPGRIRNEAFFMKMYGADADSVRRSLAPVVWLRQSGGPRLLVTTVNRVNERLQAVSDELDELPPHLKKFLDNPAGTFNWRVIAGESRLSAHSYGIAVDINAAKSDYWRWTTTDEDDALRYRNRIPMEIVEIFEKHGFIWGGRWYHYDTMHFEYRPELLPQSNE